MSSYKREEITPVSLKYFSFIEDRDKRVDVIVKLISDNILSYDGRRKQPFFLAGCQTMEKLDVFARFLSK